MADDLGGPSTDWRKYNVVDYGVYDLPASPEFTQTAPVMSAMRRFMVTIQESNWEDVDDVELPELPREGDTFETKYGTCIVTHAELLSDGGQYAGKIACRLP